MSELLYNAKIINEGKRFKGWILINDNGIIEKIGKGNPRAEFSQPGIRYADMNGHILMPGVIDSHVHFREPGLTHKASIFSESRAAAAGGVTSFMDMPNTNPATVTLEALQNKYDIAASDSLINYAFYIGATRDNLQVLKEVDYTSVPGVKLFMGSSTGGMLVEGESVLEEIFKLRALIAVHCESEQIIRDNFKRISELYPAGDAPVSLHPEVRSALVCLASSHTAVELAKRFNSRLHIMHLTTAQELSLLSPEHKNITAEACVVHLLFTDSDYERLGTRIKCNPAVKSAMHREALRKAVANGIISTVSTDHAPHTLEEKEKGTLSAPSGMPMVQFSLPVMLELAHQKLWDMKTVVERMCHAQALTFNVEKRGFLRPGYYADIVEVDPKGITSVDKSTILSKCGWSPLEGMKLHGKVISTRVNGKVVYDCNARQPIKEEKASMPLRFNPSF